MKYLDYVDKLYDAYTKYMKKCENCGHKMLITKKHPIIICHWCGHKVFYDDKTKFIDKLNKKLKS